jgi:hypothetical protein
MKSREFRLIAAGTNKRLQGFFRYGQNGERRAAAMDEERGQMRILGAFSAGLRQGPERTFSRKFAFSLTLACFSLAICNSFLSNPSIAQNRGKPNTNPNWPCQQILVEAISPAAVWAGPPVDTLDWRSDPKIGELSARLAARRLPVEDAEKEIADFAKAAGQAKTQALPALFAGIFDKLNSERSQVIAGLIRFGKKQRNLADKIKAENEVYLEAQHQKAPDGPEDPALLEKLQWDVRVFDERRQSISYVCETPVLIEKRLFALSRAIQQNLD